MDLSDLNSPLPKPWLQLQSESLTCNTLSAQSANIPLNVSNEIQLLQQVGVPNPPPGSLTIWSNNSSQLSSTDSDGKTTVFGSGGGGPYLPLDGTSSMTGALNMGNNFVNNLAGFYINAAGGVPVSPPPGGLAVVSSFGVLYAYDHAGDVHQILYGTDLAGYLPTTGGNMTGSIDMGGINNLSNFAILIPAAGINIGLGASSGDASQIAIGTNASTSASDAISIGHTVVNNVASSCLIGDPAITNIRPNSAVCSLGTQAQPFDVSYLRYGQPASSGKFAMYGSVSVNNTAVETSVTSGTSVGSLVYSTAQALGTVFRLKAQYTTAITGGFNLILNVKVNGTTLISTNMVAGALAASAGVLEGSFIVSSPGNVQGSLENRISGQPIDIVNNGALTYDPSISNTWDITALWSGANAGNLLTVNFISFESLFCT